MERLRARSIRVGIDVGGTFTDVVAIDATARELVARVKVPTTHDGPEGVAAGIVAGIEQLLRDPAIDAGAIAFIAHSTTQATNALLEGDLARVGVIGLLDGLAWLSKRQMRFRATSRGRKTPEEVTSSIISEKTWTRWRAFTMASTLRITKP